MSYHRYRRGITVVDGVVDSKGVYILRPTDPSAIRAEDDAGAGWGTLALVMFTLGVMLGWLT